MNTEAPPPDQLVMQILTGKLLSRILTAVADVGVAEHLADGPVGVAELAKKTDTNEDALYRMLRALSSVGIFAESGNRSFENNEASKLLISNVEGSLLNMVRWINCGPAWDAWGHLDYSLKTGKPAFDEVFGEQVFEYFQENEQIAEIFHGAMTSFSSMTAQAVAVSYDFTGIKKIVDVGGGHGSLLATIITQNPDLRGVVFDRPEVVQGTGANLSELTSKIDIEGGDFFEGVPKDADAYIMKHIIHDWDDDHCVRILKNCGSAMAHGGKVLVVDPVITDSPESALGKLMDIEMLAMTTGGRERTEDEFEALMAKAGLKLSRIVPTKSPVRIVEAVMA